MLGIVWSALWWGPGAWATDVTITFGCSPSNVTPDPDDNRCTPTENGTVTGSRTIAFTAQAGTGNRLRQVKVFAISEDADGKIPSAGQPNPGDPIGQNDWPTWGESQNQASLSYSWDTVTDPGYNGLFTIRVEALSQNAASQPEATPKTVEIKHVAVNNPPAKPAAPVILNASSEGVSVQWQQAKEPDLKQAPYTVYRAHTDTAKDKPKDKDFDKIWTTASDHHFDPVTEAGAYWYKVEVTRNSPVSNTGVSALSDASGDPGVVIPPPPTPEPTPLPPGQTPGPTPTPVRTPPPLPKIVIKPAPVPDAPFSTVLPYEDVPEPAPGESLPPQALPQSPIRDASQSRAGVLPVAVGAFLVSAALLLGRLPV